MQALEEKLKNLEINDDKNEIDDWKILWEWVKDYRMRNKLTIKQMLTLIGVNTFGSNVNYLTPSGLKRPPSNKRGTFGKILRDSIKKAKDNEENGISLGIAPDVLPEDRIKDVLVSNYKPLKTACKPYGFISVNVLSINEMEKTMKLQLCTSLCPKVEDIVQIRKSILRILEKDDWKCELEFIILSSTVGNNSSSYALKSFLQSPLCIKAMEAFGTTQIFGAPYSNRLIAITAAHVVDPVKHSDRLIQFIDEVNLVTGKIPYECRTRTFGYAPANSMFTKFDVAFFYPIVDLPMLVNYIPPFGHVKFPFTFDTQNNDRMITSEKAKDLRKEVHRDCGKFILAKHGIATGVTRGKITEVTDDFIFVTNLDIGPIAYYGDSGAVWVILEPENWRGYVFGIASRVTTIIVSDIIQTPIKHCVISPIWDWIEYLHEFIQDIDSNN